MCTPTYIVRCIHDRNHIHNHYIYLNNEHDFSYHIHKYISSIAKPWLVMSGGCCVCVNMRYEHKLQYVLKYTFRVSLSNSLVRVTAYSVCTHGARYAKVHICVHVSSSFLIRLGLGVRKHTVVFDFTHGVALAIVGLHM